MSDETDIKNSRKHEMRIYLDSMRSMYENALLQNGEIYDIASSLTSGFKSINSDAILSDSRIIKIFRYSIAPTISQMKFGQFFGIKSLINFEKDKVSSGTAKYRNLKKIAPKIAAFVEERLDAERFLWLTSDAADVSDLSLAKDYAKKWTCSIAADQNAQTAYRNWRKNQQEHAIASALIKLGYIKSTFNGIVTKDTDINLGEYTQEVKVKGRTIQKADLIIRSKASKRLVFVEAKAVGVEIDSTKRIKECCDKASDWRSSRDFKQPEVVAVIAGFFNEKGISNLFASDIKIIWEHRLSDLGNLL